MNQSEKKAADLAARAAANQGEKIDIVTETQKEIDLGMKRIEESASAQQGEPDTAAAEYEAELRSLKLAAARADLALKERQLELMQNPVAIAAAAQNDEDRELKEMEKQTAKYELEAARERHAQFEEDKATKIRKRKSALAAMEANKKTQENIQKICKHRVGGFGLADQYRGGMNAQTAFIKCLLPIAGMALIYCTRCKAESVTPDRKLATDNPEEYTRLLTRHLEFEELYANSYNSQPMGGPQFQFEKDGVPFRPSLV